MICGWGIGLAKCDVIQVVNLVCMNLSSRLERLLDVLLGTGRDSRLDGDREGEGGRFSFDRDVVGGNFGTAGVDGLKSL